jgi:hypothetical protein
VDFETPVAAAALPSDSYIPLPPVARRTGDRVTAWLTVYGCETSA